MVVESRGGLYFILMVRCRVLVVVPLSTCAQLDKHAGGLVASLAQLGPSPDAFLASVARAWAEFEQAIATVRAVFLVLDRTYVPTVPGQIA